MTLKAKPWLVIQREIRTPIAPILSAPTQAPVRPSNPACFPAERRGGADHHLFQVAHVPVHVGAVRAKVEDRVGDQLAGAVVGDVAAAPGLVERDAELLEPGGGGDDIGSGRVAAGAERDDVGVLEEQQHVVHATQPPLLGKLPLYCEPLAVGDRAEAPDLDRPHSHDASKFSICFFTTDMNSSATAPSISRWS